MFRYCPSHFIAQLTCINHTHQQYYQHCLQHVREKNWVRKGIRTLTQEGDCDGIRYMIQLHPHNPTRTVIDDVDVALRWACRLGNLKAVRILIYEGNARVIQIMMKISGYTRLYLHSHALSNPFFLAVKNDHVKVVSLLIQTVRDFPLVYIADVKSVEMLALLMPTFIALHDQALDNCIRSNRLDMVQWLVEQFDCPVRSRSILRAIRSKNLNMVKYVHSMCNAPWIEFDESFFIKYAFCDGSIEILDYFIDCYPYTFIKYYSNLKRLTYACINYEYLAYMKKKYVEISINAFSVSSSIN